MFIEGIIERLNNSELKKLDNEGRIVLDGTIGEYLENYNNHFLDLFLLHADGKYLDLHGLEYNIIRKEDESDISYITVQFMTRKLHLMRVLLLKRHSFCMIIPVYGYKKGESEMLDFLIIMIDRICEAHLFILFYVYSKKKLF